MESATRGSLLGRGSRYYPYYFFSHGCREGVWPLG